MIKDNNPNQNIGAMLRPNFVILSTKVEKKTQKSKMSSLKKSNQTRSCSLLGKVPKRLVFLFQLKSFQHINLFILIVWNSGKGFTANSNSVLPAIGGCRGTLWIFTGMMSPWFNFWSPRLHSLPRSHSI